MCAYYILRISASPPPCPVMTQALLVCVQYTGAVCVTAHAMVTENKYCVMRAQKKMATFYEANKPCLASPSQGLFLNEHITNS